MTVRESSSLDTVPVSAMTIDVEDYFQVSAFTGQYPVERWASNECRVERNVDRLLCALADSGSTATFFTLGWIAERYGPMVRRIAAAGHEVASHGYQHAKVHSQTPAEFCADIDRTRKLLQDLSAQPVDGYRAASFSIDDSTPWAYECLATTGHRYSSSVYPIAHDHYGSPNASRFPFVSVHPDVMEIPITTVRLLGRNWPCGGGGYFRLFPYGVSRWAFARVVHGERRSGVFYLHPWEIDPDQPVNAGADRRSRFRHYLNLDRFDQRLRRMLSAFRWTSMRAAFAHDLGLTNE